jgi:predicted RNase H-like nuclease (RuvC/YqgF family)
VIQELLEIHKDAQDSDKVFDKAPKMLNYVLKTLAEKASLSYVPTMHTLRRFLFDRLTNNMAEIKANYIIGHSTQGNVNKAYTSTEMREGFAKTMPEIAVNGNNGQIKAVKAQVSAMDTTIQQLTQIIANLTKENQDLKDQIAQQNASTMKEITDLKTALTAIQAQLPKPKEEPKSKAFVFR